MSILTAIYIIVYSATIIIFCIGVTKFFTPILITIGKKIFNLNPEYFIKTFFLLAMILALNGVFFRTPWIAITYLLNLFSFIMLIMYVYKFSSIKHTVEKFKKSKEKKTITKNKVNSNNEVDINNEINSNNEVDINNAINPNSEVDINNEFNPNNEVDINNEINPNNEVDINNEELIKYLKGLFSRSQKEDEINILLTNLINGNFDNFDKGILIFELKNKIDAGRVLFQLKENDCFDQNMLEKIYLKKFIKIANKKTDTYLNSDDFTQHNSRFTTKGITQTKLITDKIKLPLKK